MPITQRPKFINSKSTKILLVDDDLILLRSLKRNLTNEDLIIATATSAAEALVMLLKDRFDGIICDYKMAGTNGKDLLKKVAQEYPSMFRIMLTGEIHASDALMVGKRDNLDLVLHKPCDHTTLMEHIGALITKRQSARSGIFSLLGG